MKRLLSTPKDKENVFIDGFWSAYHQMCGILGKAGVVQLSCTSAKRKNESFELNFGILTRGFESCHDMIFLTKEATLLPLHNTKSNPSPNFMDS